MLRQAVGRPVQGDNFYDRETEQNELWQALEQDNLLMLAPRRVGKTSLMYRLKETASQHDFQAAYLSVSDANSEFGFVRKLYNAIQEIHADASAWEKVRLETGKLWERFMPKKVALGKAFTLELMDSAREEWALQGELLTKALHKLEGQWLLLVDELPIFVLSLLRQDPSAARTRTFLNWFRQLRQDMEGGERLRWFLAGSIGLDTVAQRHNLGDTINDLRIVGLGAFAHPVADRFLQELSTSHEFPLGRKARTHILKRVGWPIPYFLQLLFSELRAHCGDLKRSPTVRVIDQVFEELLTPSKRSYFDYWRQRLNEQLDSIQARNALTILKAIAEPAEGTPLRILNQHLSRHILDADDREKELRFLLQMLENDGYLVLEEEHYIFRSPLLREFWLAHV